MWVFSLHGFSGSHTWMDNRHGWATNWISPLLFVHSGSSVRLGTKHVAHEILLNASQYHPLMSHCCSPGNPQLPVITRGWTLVWMPSHELTEQKVTAANRSLIKNCEDGTPYFQWDNSFLLKSIQETGASFQSQVLLKELTASLKCDIKSSKM